MAICIGVFIGMKSMPNQMAIGLLNQYGMVAARYSGVLDNLPFDGYLSFVTNLFLHATWTHLVVNMWFMWIFGDNIEDRMGHLPFLAFYLICGVFATLLQWYFDPTLEIPVIGASGAIASVLAAYFFLYPMERVVVFFPPMIFHVPAIAFLGVWVLLQLNNATTAMIFKDTPINVAWWAHLGGFVAGGILYRWFIKNKNEVF